MALAAKLRRAPLRAATGALILNAGLAKFSADEQTAQGLHAMAAAAYPVLKGLDPKLFAKVLATGEVLVGGALLLPIVPAGLAGLVLTGFASGMLGVYVRTPALHDRYLRPTESGTVFAKDVWMAGVGVGLVIDAALNESPVTSTD